MNVWAKKGDKVIFTCEHGLESDKFYAKRELKVGETYTVDEMYIGDFFSSVVLKEVPGKRFNTVLFEDFTERDNYINIIEQPEYDFLRENPHLGDNVIFLTLGGSHAYGTNVEGSDLDVRGIAIERQEEIIGLNKFEQYTDENTDTTVYGLRKIIQLLSNCNPNVIELLGTKEEHILVCDKYGQMLRDNVDLFLSKRAINSFGGYATAQLRRLQNALAREGSQEEKEDHILESIERQLRELEDRYQAIDNGYIKLSIVDSEKEDLEKEIVMDIKLNNYPLRDFKNIYSEMNDIVKDYSRTYNKDSKKEDKSFGKDATKLNKHAMHLIRLLIMGKDILDGKGIKTFREDERELFLDIRNGKYTYEEIFEMVGKYEAEFREAADNSKLPDKPNYKKIQKLLMNIYKEVLSDKWNEKKKKLKKGSKVVIDYSLLDGNKLEVAKAIIGQKDIYTVSDVIQINDAIYVTLEELSPELKFGDKIFKTIEIL